MVIRKGVQKGTQAKKNIPPTLVLLLTSGHFSTFSTEAVVTQTSDSSAPLSSQLHGLRTVKDYIQRVAPGSFVGGVVIYLFISSKNNVGVSN